MLINCQLTVHKRPNITEFFSTFNAITFYVKIKKKNQNGFGISSFRWSRELWESFNFRLFWKNNLFNQIYQTDARDLQSISLLNWWFQRYQWIFKRSRMPDSKNFHKFKLNIIFYINAILSQVYCRRIA